MSASNFATVTVSRAAVRDTVLHDGSTRGYPFQGSLTSARTQMLVEQAQMGYGGVIDSIAWKMSSPNVSSVTFQNFTIKLVHTLHAHSSPALSTTFATNYDGETPTTVFGPATFTVPPHAAGDLIWIDVNDIFTYDDVRNLIVEVTFNNPATSANVSVQTESSVAGQAWSLNATPYTATSATLAGNRAFHFVFRFAGDSQVLHPYDGNSISLDAGDGSTYLFGATSSGSGVSQRWMTNQTLGGAVTNGTIGRTFYNQFLPAITLSGTNAGNTVATSAHTQFGASLAGPGKYGVFSEWCDRGSLITFAAATTLGWTTSDTRSFTVNNAFTATIHYTPPVVEPKYRFLTLRADSANGATHFPVPGAGGPWQDLVNNHDATLVNFTGTLANGWKGNGTHDSPYRLEFAGEDQGFNNHVTIPGGSIPELQQIGALTAMVWFKTGMNGTNDHYDYILEWVQRPAEPYDPEYEGRGMSIIVQDGTIQVYANPWVNVAPATPNTWYHVAVVKDTNEMRVYVNGVRRFAGIKSHRGLQESELTLGCSVFRTFEQPYFYGDFFNGSIAAVDLWQGALDDGEVFARFAQDSAMYLPNPPPLPIAKVLDARAAAADRTNPYPIPGAASPWKDLAGAPNDLALGPFAGNPSSGWIGNGSPMQPYRLKFDGFDDVATVPAQTLSGLADASAYTVGLWAQTGPNVESPGYRYLLEWLEGQGSGSGMSIAIQAGALQVYLANPSWAVAAPVTSNTWEHVIVAKEPGEVRVYLNGARVYTTNAPMIGDQATELVLGASTWRGPQQYGDYYDGSIAQLQVWQGALNDSAALAEYNAQSGQYLGGTNAVGDVPKVLALAGVFPNPAWDRFRVSFSLPARGHTTLELIDVSGRRLRTREWDDLAPGSHSVDLGDRADLNAGVYWVRLTHGAKTISRKVTLL